MFAKVILSTILFTLASMSISAETGITIDGDFEDWAEIPVLVDDPDDVEEDNGDLKAIKVVSDEVMLYLLFEVYGEALPAAGRFYFHLLIDLDNSLNTGFDNSMYEGNETKVKTPIGADFYVQIGWRNGAPDGIEVYYLNGVNDEVVSQDFAYEHAGTFIEAAVAYDQFIARDNLGVEMEKGTKVRISAFQEGDANDWECDWMESEEYVLGSSWPVDPEGKIASTWAVIKTR